MKLANIEDLKKISVVQLANKNQFVITYSKDGELIKCFQSYKSLVAVYDVANKVLFVSWLYWDYSKTTLKHFKMFVNEYTSFTYETKQQFIKEIKNNNNIILI